MYYKQKQLNVFQREQKPWTKLDLRKLLKIRLSYKTGIFGEFLSWNRMRENFVLNPKGKKIESKQIDNNLELGAGVE